MTTHLPKGGSGIKKLGKCFLTSNLFCNLLYHYLPLSIKKSIFMAIVVEVMHERYVIKRRPDKLPLQVLADIHSKKLAKEYAYQAPEILNNKSAQIQLADFFYRSIPKCFRYASYRSVKHDIIDSLKNCPKLDAQCA